MWFLLQFSKTCLSLRVIKKAIGKKKESEYEIIRTRGENNRQRLKKRRNNGGMEGNDKHQNLQKSAITDTI